MYIAGVEGWLAKDMAKAFHFSQRACELGNLYACANLSQMYQKVRPHPSTPLYLLSDLSL
jgi:cytochrome c oxidase assembly factor 7